MPQHLGGVLVLLDRCDLMSDEARDVTCGGPWEDTDLHVDIEIRIHKLTYIYNYVYV